MYSIGQLSQRTGVKVPTIRYYEQMKLVEADERSEGNQRRYSRAGLERLAFIKHARELGLSIETIRALISLDAGGDDLAEAHQIAGDHLRDVRSRIERLRQLETELTRMMRACDGHHEDGCGILQAFSDHALCEGEH